MEADVVMGRLFGENDSVAKRPVMAHPPETESDITLTDFINTIMKVFKLVYTKIAMARIFLRNTF